MNVSRVSGWLLGGLLLAASDARAASPCIILVHGLQKNANTDTSYDAAWKYWLNQDKGTNFITTVTKGGALPHYTVGYNGTLAWWRDGAAGEVTREIIRAAEGRTDASGRFKCDRTFAAGGKFIVVAHSMGAVVMDYILGNSRSSDINYNKVARFDLVEKYVSKVYSLSGPHRGSQAADAVCGEHNADYCNNFGWAADHVFQKGSCNRGNSPDWIRTADSVQVKLYSSASRVPIYLTAGYESDLSSTCLAGEDDGAVQYASAFACAGNPRQHYNNGDKPVCDNREKMFSGSGMLRNMDAAHERHADIKDDSDRDQRKAIPDGLWWCNGVPCKPGTEVHTRLSTAEFLTRFH